MRKLLKHLAITVTLLSTMALSCSQERVGSPTTEVSRPLGGDLTLVALRVVIGATSLAVGDTIRARATGLNSSSSELAGIPVTWATSDPAVATVTAEGLVRALAPGSAELTATAGLILGRVTLRVEPPSTAVALPEPPRVYLTPTIPTVSGRVIRVGAGDDLQRAFDNARRGDEVVLEAGVTWRGNFVLGAKVGSVDDGWVLVRSSRLSELAGSQRVQPGDTALLARIETADQRAALATALGAAGWWLAGIEIGVRQGFLAQQDGIVRLGDGSEAQSTPDRIATDLVLDRVYVHGNTDTNTKRCVALNSARTVIRDSYVSECHGRGFDSQALAGWNGPGPYAIINNHLAGASENVIFGGGDPSIHALAPSDIEFRRNHVVTPVAWRGRWPKKNLFELKHAQRVLIEGNVFDGSWADGQAGFAFVLKSTNQGNRCSWCSVTDVTIRDNVVRNVGAGFNLAGAPDPYPVSAPLSRVLIEHNVVERVLTDQFTGDGRLVQIIAGTRDLTIRYNTMTGSPALNSFLTLGDAGSGRNVELRANIFSLGQYGLKAAGRAAGTASLATLGGIVVVTDNVLIGPPSGAYPPRTTFVSSIDAARALGTAGADVPRVTRAISGVERP